MSGCTLHIENKKRMKHQIVLAYSRNLYATKKKKKIKINFNGEYAKSEMLSSKQDKNDGMKKKGRKQYRKSKLGIFIAPRGQSSQVQIAMDLTFNVHLMLKCSITPITD